VNGFCGMRLTEKGLVFEPHLPKAWKSLSFSIIVRGNLYRIVVTKKDVTIFPEKVLQKGMKNKLKVVKNKILF
ncbi:MAG: hypothetical protein KKH98_13350, partial [Spirochaetes bacterium]|nr:hypothetical protein [Spirochaetota bacterium]